MTAEVQEKKAHPLTSLEYGEPAELLRIEGGLGIGNRLLSMGFRTGVRLEVLNKMGKGGNIVVRAGKSRIALGYKIAQQIFVA